MARPRKGDEKTPSAWLAARRRLNERRVVAEAVRFAHVGLGLPLRREPEEPERLPDGDEIVIGAFGYAHALLSPYMRAAYSLRAVEEAYYEFYPRKARGPQRAKHP